VLALINRCRGFALAIAAALALLLVFAPSTLQLAVDQSSQPTNEETPEDRGKENEEARGVQQQPRIQPPESRSKTITVTPPQIPASGPVASVAPPVHPSQFSVRRLI
jgi:hypothetical protein